MRRIGLAGFIAGALLISSCGGKPSQNDAQPVLRGHATVAGAYNFNAPFRFAGSPSTDRGSCREAAKHGTTNAGFVFGATAKASQRVALLFGIRTAPYLGPASYATNSSSVTGLMVLSGAESTEFRATPRSATSVTTRDDGSGKATLSNLAAADGRTVSVHLDWTCMSSQFSVPG